MSMALVKKVPKNAIFIHVFHIFHILLTYIREKKFIYIKNKLRKKCGNMYKAKK